MLCRTRRDVRDSEAGREGDPRYASTGSRTRRDVRDSEAAIPEPDNSTFHSVAHAVMSGILRRNMGQAFTRGFDLSHTP